MLTKKQTKKYLDYLNVDPFPQNLLTLNKLIKSQLIKFPFENISKLILQERKQLNGLVDFDTHLNNSIKFGFGGTCYACNYYFNELLKSIGFKVTLHGSRMGKSKDVHIVSLIDLNSDIYHIDVGYGAPFYKANQLTKSTVKIKWGNLLYKLNHSNQNAIEVSIEKNNEKLHGYCVNNIPRDISHFSEVILESFSHNSEFMKCIKVIRFFENYGIELKNNRYIIHKDNKSSEYKVKNSEELEEIMISEFHLQNIPIKNAVNILNKRKHINIFEDQS